MADLHLPQAAGDYTAGDLTPEETLRFEELMAQDPGLREETAFWRGLRSGALADPGPAPAPVGDLAQVIFRRSALAVRRPVAPRPRVWFWPMASAAMLMVAVGAWFTGRATAPVPTQLAALAPTIVEKDEVSFAQPIAWSEDGSPVMPPPSSISWSSYMPQTVRFEVETSRPVPVVNEAKPWIGVWTKPAKLLERGTKVRDAHLVVRVVEGSPAWSAGIRPGDMLMSVNGCPLMTSECLGEAMVTLHAGDEVPAVWWSAEDAKRHEGRMMLQAVHE